MRTINYHGGQKIYDTEQIDGMIAPINEKIEHIEEAVAEGSYPIGTVMFWPVSETVTRTVHSDNPFEFTVHGVHYSVAVPDAEVELCVSKGIPEGWHALDGTAELSAEEYSELAEFIPDNVTTENKIWLPYVRQKIIKVKNIA